MATPVFQPPPTHTEVILKDAQSRWLFNPAWVKWFLELTQMINNSGGGSGTIQHNSTGGLQGGGTGEYYHLTNQEHGWVADTPAAPTTKFWRGDHTWTGTLAGPFQATNITGTGNLSIQGNTTLGDSITDTITFTGQMASTLLWGTDNTLDIGASGANRPRDLYLGRDLYVGGTLTITGGIVITGDLTVNGNTTLGNSTVDTLTIASSAITWSGTPTHSGNHTWSGNMTVNGNVTVKGNTAIGDATSDTFTIAPNNITWTNNPTHSGNHAWSGRQVINTTSNTHSILAVGGSATLLVGTTQNAIELNPIFSAAATNSEYAIVTQTTGASGVHNTATVAGINIQDHTTGTSQTVSSSYGILIDDRTSTVSVRAAGIRSNLTSGSSKYNIYAIGTAMNVLAGNTRVGGGTDPTVALDVTGAALISTTLGVTGTLTASGNLTVNGNTTLGDSNTDTLTISPNAVTWSNNPTHSANHTFSGNVTVNGVSTLNGNVVVGDASTDTLTIAPNAVTWSNNPTHSGNHIWSGNITVNGNTTLGDSTADTIIFTGRMSSGITWTTDNTLDIGASGANRPRDGFFGRNVDVGGTLTVAAANASIITAGTIGTARLGSGTADTRYFLRGDQSWQRVWNVIQKPSDETRSSTVTIAADTDLIVALAANKTYSIRFLYVVTSTSNTPGFRFRLTGPATPTAISAFFYRQTDGASLTSVTVSAYPGADTTVSIPANLTAIIVTEVVVTNGANTGNITLSWAQSISDGTGTTVKKGSYVEYTQLD